jgi:hypothetical protein
MSREGILRSKMTDGTLVVAASLSLFVISFAAARYRFRVI